MEWIDNRIVWLESILKRSKTLHWRTRTRWRGWGGRGRASLSNAAQTTTTTTTTTATATTITARNTSRTRRARNGTCHLSPLAQRVNNEIIGFVVIYAPPWIISNCTGLCNVAQLTDLLPVFVNFSPRHGIPSICNSAGIWSWIPMLTVEPIDFKMSQVPIFSSRLKRWIWLWKSPFCSRKLVEAKKKIQIKWKHDKPEMKLDISSRTGTKFKSWLVKSKTILKDSKTNQPIQVGTWHFKPNWDEI